MSTAIIAITTKSSISVKPFRLLVMSRPFNEAHGTQRDLKRPSLSCRKEIAVAATQSGTRCRNARMNAPSGEMPGTRVASGPREANRAPWLAAGSKSPRPTLRGDTVWLEMVYPAATKHPTRPTATGIKPEI